MNAIHSLSTLALSLLALGAAGDRPAAPGRVMAGLAAPAGGRADRLPPFTVFGWVSPPIESTSTARIAEMSAAGLTLATPAFTLAGELDGGLASNLTRLGLLAARGMDAIVWDDRFSAYNTLDPDSPEGGAHMDSIVADYAGHAEMLGWDMGDEPPASEFDLLGRIHAQLRARDPTRIMWDNLRGRGYFATREDYLAYTRDYVARVKPEVLSNDQYDFHVGYDTGLFVEDVAGLAAVARENGLPFWGIVLVTPHADFRPLTPGLMRWQIGHLLAYGARGFGYFTYWTPVDAEFSWQDGLIARDGTPGPLYATAAALAPRLQATGEALARLTWLATVHAGSCPRGGTPFVPDDGLLAVEGRAAIGRFADAVGPGYLLVANSDSVSARTVTLVLPHATRVDALGDAVDAWTPLALAPGDGGARVTLALEPGDFLLLHVTGSPGTLRAGRGPTLRGWPSPAAGHLRIAYAGLGPHGHLEVLDAAGRRVWSARPAAGDGVVTWAGEREGGGTAGAGVYFARIEDGRGVAAARLVWLGAR